MPDTKLTAKDFKVPLMRVLSDLTDKRADLPVALKATYDPVCQVMGIHDVNQFGNNDATNSPWVEKWIQWAFDELVSEGKAKRMGRGQWALTEAGVQTMNDIPTTPVETTTDAGTPVSAASPVTLTLKVLKPEDAYHQDEYIRTLAAKATACFGSYAQQSNTCDGCPLNVACRNAMMVELVNLSRVLVDRDAKEEADRIAQEKAAKAAENAKNRPSASESTQAPLNPSVTTASVAPSGPADLIIIHKTSVCSKCGNPVQKGSKGYWVKAQSGGRAGLYHPECYTPSK